MYGDDMKAGIAKLKEITSPAIKKSLAQNFAYSLSPGNEENESLFNTLTAMRSDTAFVNKLTKKYEVLKKLVKGEKSPQFENYKNFDGTITSLNDLTGKYVYVDVWATWCGPCKAEIPYLKEVEEKYHGKNIQFVSISVDKAEDEDKWKTMVTDKELGGIQLFADNDWNSKFVKDYAIEGIPRFILIDTEGNIVTGDAPRPSDDKLIQLFTELGI
jgi:thiol-disulfide isomerase/thioredoxin